MIAVYASVLVAIINDEPERETYLQTLGAAADATVSPVSVVEARMVLQGRLGNIGPERVNDLLAALEISIAAIDAEQLDIRPALPA